MSNQSIWEKENRELRAVLATWKETAGRKHERIAELEVQNDERLKIWNESITITAAQIDAAWGLLRNLESIPSTHSDTAHDILECIGIIACEECGGSGLMPGGDIQRICTRVPCPDCNGRGWVEK